MTATSSVSVHDPSCCSSSLSYVDLEAIVPLDRVFCNIKARWQVNLPIQIGSLGKQEKERNVSELLVQGTLKRQLPQHLQQSRLTWTGMYKLGVYPQGINGSATYLLSHRVPVVSQALIRQYKPVLLPLWNKHDKSLYQLLPSWA